MMSKIASICRCIRPCVHALLKSASQKFEKWRYVIIVVALLAAFILVNLVRITPTPEQTHIKLVGSCPSAKSLLESKIPRSPQGIPKIFHQIYKNFEVPVTYQPLVQHCSDLNQDFLHILWTEQDFEEFLMELRPGWISLFKNYVTGVQKADIMRLMILQHFGGVYLDLDVECRKPFTSYLRDHNATCIFDREPQLQTMILHQRNALLMNSVIMVVPNHPFIIHLVDQLRSVLMEHSTLARTGPVFITERYHEYGRTNPAVIQTIFHAPSSHFSPVIDPICIEKFDRYCKMKRTESWQYHPLFRLGCARWKHERSLHVIVQSVENEIVNSYLVHRFLHLGYMLDSEDRRKKTFHICEKTARIARYGSVDLEVFFEQNTED